MANMDLNQQLNLAVKNGQVEVIKQLLVAGADPNNTGFPLHAACTSFSGSKVEMVKVLLSAGAKADAPNAFGKPPLFELIARDNPSAEVAELLLDAGCAFSQKNALHGTALGWAAECGRETLIDVLLRRGADVNGEKGTPSPLSRAFSYGKRGAARLLIEHGADVDVSFNYGNTPLGHAILAGDQVLFETVLAHKKSSKIDPRFLLTAAQFGHLKMVAMLVEAGAAVDGNGPYSGPTPLVNAAERGRHTVVKYLLEKGADFKACDSHGDQALHRAAGAGHVEVLKCLLAAGADLHAKNGLQRNALMQACSGGHYEAAKLLIEIGASLNEIEGEKGTTALTMAKAAKAEPLVRLMIAHGAKERDIRRPKAGEAYFAITDCDICYYLPHKKELDRNENPDDIPNLELIHYQSFNPDNYSTRTNIILRCPVCGTYYHQDHYIDTEDSVATPPTMEQHLQRYNFLGLKETLKAVGKVQELEEFEQRYPDLITQFRNILKHDTRAQRRNITPHLVESVVDALILRDAWEELETALLDHQDPYIVLEATEDLIEIFGGLCNRGTYPWFGNLHDCTQAVKDKLTPWLTANRSMLEERLQSLLQKHDEVLKQRAKNVHFTGTYTKLFSAKK